MRCVPKSTCVGFNYRTKSAKYVVNCQLSNEAQKRENDESGIEKLEDGLFLSECEFVYLKIVTVIPATI